MSSDGIEKVGADDVGLTAVRVSALMLCRHVSALLREFFNCLRAVTLDWIAYSLTIYGTVG
jgi:hypothetical protein